MKFPDKTSTIEAALEGIRDGATVMIGGFGVPGTPFTLIRELLRQGASRLTIIKNDANEAGMGVDHLLAAGRVARLITSHIGLNPNAVAAMNAGRIEVEFCAQGILAERIRAGGAGLAAVLTDIGIDTELGRGKPRMRLGGAEYIAETALRADVALIHAAVADPFGNLVYAAAARNFSPLMAMAADRVVAETEELRPLGGLPPAQIHTPGPFVDRVVHLETLGPEYAVVRRA